MKAKVLTIFFFAILLTFLFFSKKIGFNISNDVISLDEIKEKLLKTEKIYLCSDWDSISGICPKKNIIKYIDDGDIIKEFIDITYSLEENTGVTSLAQDVNTLYFVDGRGKTIASARFGRNFILRARKVEYELDPIHNDRLKELIDFKY